MPVAALRGPLHDVGVPLDPPARRAAHDDRRALGPFRIGVAARQEELPIGLRKDPADGVRIFDFLQADDLDPAVREPRHDGSEPLEIGRFAQVTAAPLIAAEDFVLYPVAEPGDVPGSDGDPGGGTLRRGGSGDEQSEGARGCRQALTAGQDADHLGQGTGARGQGMPRARMAHRQGTAGQFSRWGPPTGIARERETRAEDAVVRRRGRGKGRTRRSHPRYAVPSLSGGECASLERRGGISRNGLRSHCNGRSRQKSAMMRPTTLQNLKPCPENPAAMNTSSFSG